jgi:Protein of unknown function (DUF3237)
MHMIGNGETIMLSRREVMGSVLAASVLAAKTEATDAPAQMGSRFAFEASVSVATPLVVGQGSHGLRRVVPITGGTVKGSRLNGRVVPGGADWQVVRPDGVLGIEARYTLESHDGVLIMVTNRGLRRGPPAVIEKLSRGEPVASSEYYFRTTAEFEAPTQSSYAWLNQSIFVGVAERTASAAIIRFYEVL